MIRDHYSIILLFLRRNVRLISRLRKEGLKGLTFRRFIDVYIESLQKIINEIGDDLGL